MHAIYHILRMRKMLRLLHFLIHGSVFTAKLMRSTSWEGASTRSRSWTALFEGPFLVTYHQTTFISLPTSRLLKENHSYQRQRTDCRRKSFSSQYGPSKMAAHFLPGSTVSVCRSAGRWARAHWRTGLAPMPVHWAKEGENHRRT